MSLGTVGPQASPRSAHPDPACRVQRGPTTWAVPWPWITRAEPPARNTVVREAALVGSAQRSVCHVLGCGCGRLPSFVIIIKYNLAGGGVGAAVSPAPHACLPVGEAEWPPAAQVGRGRCLLTYSHMPARGGLSGHCILACRAIVTPHQATCQATSPGGRGPWQPPGQPAFLGGLLTQLCWRQNRRAPLQGPVAGAGWRATSPGAPVPPLQSGAWENSRGEEAKQPPIFAQPAPAHTPGLCSHIRLSGRPSWAPREAPCQAPAHTVSYALPFNYTYNCLSHVSLPPQM